MTGTDQGIAGGWGCPPLGLTVIPATPMGDSARMQHDLLARGYFASRAACPNVCFINTYAVWVGSGDSCLNFYLGDCEDHTRARVQALARANELELETPAAVLVVGPWHGDPKQAPVGAVVAVRWTPSMYRIADPYQGAPEEQE